MNTEARSPESRTELATDDTPDEGAERGEGRAHEGHTQDVHGHDVRPDENAAAESVAAVVDDIEAYLQRWLARTNRVLGHAYDLARREEHLSQLEGEYAQRGIELSRREQDLAEQEHDLHFRERQLTETTEEFGRLRERWAVQRDAEIAQMQQQVEELTEAWLRLEHEQRSSAFPSVAHQEVAKLGDAGDANSASIPHRGVASHESGDSENAADAPGRHEANETSGVTVPAVGAVQAGGTVPAVGAVSTGGSGPQPAVSGPATRTSRPASDASPSGERPASNAGRLTLPSPAPIPATLKGRHASTPSGEPTQPDDGRPAKISQDDPAGPPPPRESSFEQFQHLQRELGHTPRPNL